MKLLLRSIFLLLSICFLSSWGFLVHRTVNQLAIYELPKGMQNFFYKNMDYLVKYSVRPDQRRNKDSTEATKHFIDLEAYGKNAATKMPLNWDAAVAKYSKDTLLEYGYVPYHVITMKNKLTNAFKKGLADSILFYAADMGHYISDACVPLHTTINYDGQLSNQKGLHSLWESMIPELELTNYQLTSLHKAKYLSNPSLSIWKGVRKANKLLNNVFEMEIEASKSFTDSTKYRTQIRNGKPSRSYTTAFAKAYATKLGNEVNSQLIYSANLIADFWYTCWVDAGKPDLNKLIIPPMSEEEKQNLKNEIEAFKRNQLIEKKLLLAKQNNKDNE